MRRQSSIPRYVSRRWSGGINTSEDKLVNEEKPMNQKIKDEAREKIKTIVDPMCNYKGQCRVWDDYSYCPTCQADQILSLSGETDEVCPDCMGKKRMRRLVAYLTWDWGDCPTCESTGTIKKKWHIEIVEG